MVELAGRKGKRLSCWRGVRHHALGAWGRRSGQGGGRHTLAETKPAAQQSAAGGGYVGPGRGGEGWGMGCHRPTGASTETQSLPEDGRAGFGSDPSHGAGSDASLPWGRRLHVRGGREGGTPRDGAETMGRPSHRCSWGLRVPERGRRRRYPRAFSGFRSISWLCRVGYHGHLVICHSITIGSRGEEPYFGANLRTDLGRPELTVSCVRKGSPPPLRPPLNQGSGTDRPGWVA